MLQSVIECTTSKQTVKKRVEQAAPDYSMFLAPRSTVAVRLARCVCRMLPTFDDEVTGSGTHVKTIEFHIQKRIVVKLKMVLDQGRQVYPHTL